jgi:hypothetical protein
MTASPTEQAYRVHQHVAVVDTGDRVTVLRIDAKPPIPLTLNGSAHRVWAAIDGARDDEAVIGRVAEEFDVEVDVVRAQVQTFLAELEELGMVERSA